MNTRERAQASQSGGDTIPFSGNPSRALPSDPVGTTHLYWHAGEPMQGRKFSECPAEYLDMVAERLDYFASQAEATGELATNGKPVAGYKRLDAARARGWAKRIREGKHVQAKAPAPAAWAQPPAPDDDVPF